MQCDSNRDKKEQYFVLCNSGYVVIIWGNFKIKPVYVIGFLATQLNFKESRISLVSVSKNIKLIKTANIHTHKSPRNAPSGVIFISQASLLFKNAQHFHLQPQLVDALKISIKRSSGKWALTVPLAVEKRRPFFSDFWQCLLNLIEVQSLCKVRVQSDVFALTAPQP